VDIDFAKNVDGVLYRAAFEVESEGYTQKWGAGVWLELFSDVTGEFKSQPIRGGDFEARPYDVDFVLFGVERTNAPIKTENLVALLNEIIRDCG
jgi:hypothetical protein